jgi:hypothetical protein
VKTHQVHAELRIERAVEEAFAYFSDPCNLAEITPPCCTSVAGCEVTSDPFWVASLKETDG